MTAVSKEDSDEASSALEDLVSDSVQISFTEEQRGLAHLSLALRFCNYRRIDRSATYTQIPKAFLKRLLRDFVDGGREYARSDDNIRDNLKAMAEECGIHDLEAIVQMAFEE